MKVTANFLLECMQQHECWRPTTWTEQTLYHGGFCFTSGIYHEVFHQHTPRTIGVSCSPAFIGLRDAMTEFGDDWVRVLDGLNCPYCNSPMTDNQLTRPFEDVNGRGVRIWHVHCHQEFFLGLIGGRK